MAGGIPIMSVYRPASPRATAPPVPRTDTESQPLDWTHTSGAWSRIYAQAHERFQQCVIEAEIDPDQAKHQAVLRRHREELAKALAERDRQVAERTRLLLQQDVEAQARYDRQVDERVLRERGMPEQAQVEQDREITEGTTLLGRQEAQRKARAEAKREVTQQTISLEIYTGILRIFIWLLILTCILFLVILIKAPRCSEGVRVSVSMTCDLAPNLIDGSYLSIIFWIAVALGLISQSGVAIAAMKTATLSERLHKADAADWERVFKYIAMGSLVGPASAAIPLAWEIILVFQGKCKGNICLDLGLVTPAVMFWTLLAFILGALFLEGGHKAIAGGWKLLSDTLRSKKPGRELVWDNDIELTG